MCDQLLLDITNNLPPLVQENGLREQLQKRWQQLSAMDVEDLSAVKEELFLTEALLKRLEDTAAANGNVASEGDRSAGSISNSLQLIV